MSIRKLHPFYKILLFAGCFFGVERFCYFQTRGFSLPNIYADEHSQTEYTYCSTPRLDAKIFAQPYFFLAMGAESYAFLSQDGHYVLKFFKHHRLKRAHLWTKLLPLPSLKRHYANKKKILERSFNSSQIAYEDLSEESGCMALHIGKTENLFPTVTIVDPLGNIHKVPLDEVSFLLQKRADLFFSALQNKDINRAQKSISSLLELIVGLSKKGIADRDPILSRNYGFIGEQAIIIDTGSFDKNPFLQKACEVKRTLFYETLPLRCLLKQRYPELLPHFETEFEKIMEKEDL